MESRPKKQKVEPGPELPQDQNQAGVTYLDFDQLESLNIQSEEQRVEVFRNMQAVADTYS